MNEEHQATAQESKPTWLKYRTGQKNKNDYKILHIYSIANAYIIYEVETDNIERKYFFLKRKETRVATESEADECPNYVAARSCFNSMMGRAKYLLPPRKLVIAQNILVGCMAEAFGSDKQQDISGFFKEGETYIENFLEESAQFHYITMSIIFTLLTVLPAFICHSIWGKNNFYYASMGAFAGSIGALVSILQRFDKITIQKYSSWRFLVVRSVSRIIIGTVFGGFFVLFQKSGLVLNILSTNAYLLYCFAFISGFSERYFPELISKFENQQTEIAQPKVKDEKTKLED